MRRRGAAVRPAAAGCEGVDADRPAGRVPARFRAAPLSHTSGELLPALRGERTVPHDRLARLLQEADLVKFARRPISSERAREIGREARAVVQDEHAAANPAPPAQAAA